MSFTCDDIPHMVPKANLTSPQPPLYLQTKASLPHIRRYSWIDAGIDGDHSIKSAEASPALVLRLDSVCFDRHFASVFG
jgi:hypothetical protein